MGTPPHDDTPVAESLRVITLSSATTPMPLHVPFVHELEGFTVFRSLNGEDESKLYHLHVGYFANERRAREALLVIRKYFPFAMIELAPTTGLGSLDDTLETDFEVIRHASARVVARKPLARALAPPPPQAFAPKQPQRYAVLLSRRPFPGDSAPIARLPDFQGRYLYGVRASDDGGDCQDVRIGFFEDLPRARQFAESIHSHFPLAAALPVSDREHARVIDLMRQSVQSGRIGSSAPSANVRDASAIPTSARS